MALQNLQFNMEDIKPLLQTASLFNERHSVAIRIWHWLILIVISASLGTVFLTSTLFSTRGNIQMVQEQIRQKGGGVTDVQARAVAHAYTDKVWKLHILIGYALCFLLLSRIVIELSHPKEDRLGRKLKKALTLAVENDDQKRDKRHYLYVKYGYLIFYFFFLIMALSGLGLAFEENPFFRSLREVFSTIHSVTQSLIYLFVVIHLTGVIRADLTDNKGMVSRMINGKLS
jgi:Ni/Fe-hydrogenase 1 B-type cytochrome subunit